MITAVVKYSVQVKEHILYYLYRNWVVTLYTKSRIYEIDKIISLNKNQVNGIKKKKKTAHHDHIEDEMMLLVFKIFKINYLRNIYA